MFSPQRNLKYSKIQKGLAWCKDYKHIHVGNTKWHLKIMYSFDMEISKPKSNRCQGFIQV